MRVAIAVLLVGCASDDEPIEQPMPVETPSFVAILCTSGTPNSPNCPENVIPLDIVGADGRFKFTVTVLSSHVIVSNATFVAGASGLYVEHPTFITHLQGAPATSSTTFADTVLNIPANETVMLDDGVLFVDGTATLSIRFDAIGPYRP